MRFLYYVFGHPPDNNSPNQTPLPVPILSRAVSGAEFIAQMPPLPPQAPPSPGTRSGKSDYEKRDRRARQTGDRGEAIVLALEQKRLAHAGKPQLASSIQHVSQENDHAGYDILSFDEDGTPRPIEVKATSAPDLRLGFCITANELEQSSTAPNYHLYLVFDALSTQPRVLPIKKPNLNGSPFTMRALSYHVTTASVTQQNAQANCASALRSCS